MKDYRSKYKEEEEDNISNGTLGFTLVVIIATILVILWAIDALALDARYSLHINTKADCEYVVPDGWEIVSNGKFYAVRCTKSWLNLDNGSYLWQGNYRIDLMHETIAVPSLFFNECKAKGYLKEYFKEQGSKMKGFEPINK